MRLTRASTVCKWLVILLYALITAVGTSFVAFSMGYMSWLTSRFRNWVLGHIASDTEQTWQSMLWYTLFNLTLAGTAGLGVLLISPEASGSGIPDIMAYLNGVDIDVAFFSLQTFLVKVFGSVLTTGASLVVGKEGSLLHVGSALAHMFAQLAKRFINSRDGNGKPQRGALLRHDMRDLVTVGASVGVCAVFRAPVGGMLYLMELSSRWRPELTWRAFFACAATAYTLALFTARCVQVDSSTPVPRQCAFYTSGGLGSLPTLTYERAFALTDMIGVIVLGILGGLVGAAFCKLNVVVCKARRQALSFTSCGTFLEVLVISLATSALHLVLPVFGTCLPCTPHDVGPPPPDNYGSPPHFTLDALSFSSVLGLGAMPARMSGYTTICGAGLKRFRAFTPFQCAPDHYNDLTVLLFNTANEAVAALLGRFHGRPFTLLSLTAFFLFYFFMTVWTYGAAIPSGFFTPNILMGAILGRGYAMVLVSLGLTSDPEGAGNMYAILGSAAVFGGTMRCTVSICVILLEMTHTASTLPYLMLALVVSKGVADRFNDSVFVKHALSVKKMQYIARMPHLVVRRSQLKAAAIVKRDMHPLQLRSSSAAVLRVLEADRGWDVWPVFDRGEEPPLTGKRICASQLAGFVERSDLVQVLVQHLEQLLEREAASGSAGLPSEDAGTNGRNWLGQGRNSPGQVRNSLGQKGVARTELGQAGAHAACGWHHALAADDGGTVARNASAEDHWLAADPDGVQSVSSTSAGLPRAQPQESAETWAGSSMMQPLMPAICEARPQTFCTTQGSSGSEASSVYDADAVETAADLVSIATASSSHSLSRGESTGLLAQLDSFFTMPSMMQQRDGAAVDPLDPSPALPVQQQQPAPSGPVLRKLRSTAERRARFDGVDDATDHLDYSHLAALLRHSTDQAFRGPTPDHALSMPLPHHAAASGAFFGSAVQSAECNEVPFEPDARPAAVQQLPPSAFGDSFTRANIPPRITSPSPLGARPVSQSRHVEWLVPDAVQHSDDSESTQQRSISMAAAARVLRSSAFASPQAEAPHEGAPGVWSSSGPVSPSASAPASPRGASPFAASDASSDGHGITASLPAASPFRGAAAHEEVASAGLRRMAASASYASLMSLASTEGVASPTAAQSPRAPDAVRLRADMRCSTAPSPISARHAASLNMTRHDSVSFADEPVSPRATGRASFSRAVRRGSAESTGEEDMLDLSGIVKRCGISISPGMSVERVFQLFNAMACRFLPVIDGKGKFHGVITRREIVRCQWQMNELNDSEVADQVRSLAAQVRLPTGAPGAETSVSTVSTLEMDLECTS